MSATTGAGLTELRAALTRASAAVSARATDRPARLFVDRVFTLRGIGTVVTGTLWSGTIAEGDELTHHTARDPDGGRVRVRSVQVHDASVPRGEAGQRVALALAGVERNAVHRGDALVTPGAFPTSYRLDVTLEELEPIPHGSRLVAHHGTSRIPVRVVRVGEHHAQLRLASPVVAARGDRLVLRSGTTVGGGVVLDPAPPRQVSEARAALLDGGDPASIVRALVHAPVRIETLAARALLSDDELEDGLDAVRVEAGWAFSDAWLEETVTSIEERLRARAEASPLDPGLALAELLPDQPWASVVLSLLPVESRGGKAFLPGTAASVGGREEEAVALREELERAGCSAVKVADAELARFLEDAGCPRAAR